MALACAPIFAIAQPCTPDLSITQPGMYPDETTDLPQAYVGVPYSACVQFKVLTDTVISGTFVDINTVTLDSVSGLPPGFTWASNPANHVFPGGSNACATMSGNPLLSLVGTYHLVVHLTIRGLAFGFIPVTQAQTVTGYRIIINGPPVIYFSGTPLDICEGEAVTFDDNTTGHPTTWQWSFPGGTPSGSTLQIPPPVVYSTSGNKAVTLTVTSPAGSQTKTKNSYITVSASPVATITPSGNITVCSGNTVSLSANTGVGFSYQWLKNGVNISGANSAGYHASATGDYSVEISLATGCSGISPATHINITSVAATITPSGPTSFCNGGFVMLNANSGSGLSYQWKKNGVDISGATQIDYKATTAGTYKVEVTNSGGCTGLSGGENVSVSSLPAAVITPGGPLTFCDDKSVLLNANSGSGLTYQWKQGNANIPGATDIYYNASNSGTYKVIVTNSGGCSKTSQGITVSVVTSPLATISANGPLTFCEGQNVILSATPGTGLSYQWTKHNINIPGATGNSLNVTTTGNYKVVVTNASACSDISSPKNIVVNSLPAATVTENGPLTFCEGENVLLAANSGSGLTYQWKQGNANIPGATDVSFNASNSGSYKVIVTKANGCSKTSVKKTVLVNDLPPATITANGPLTFCEGQSVNLTSNSGIGLTYQWTKHNFNISGATNTSYLAKKAGTYRVVITNLNGCTKSSNKLTVTVPCREEEAGDISQRESFRAYPNPASAVTTIEMNLLNPETISIKLLDVTGKLIADIANGYVEEGKHEFNFDVSGLERGMYFICINSEGRARTIKLAVDGN